MKLRSNFVVGFLTHFGWSQIPIASNRFSLNLRVDTALQTQSWLLNLKRPAKRPQRNLYNFLQANQSELSQSDASYIVDDRFRRDLAALSWNEKEPLSVFLEKYLYPFFEDKVCV